MRVGLIQPSFIPWRGYFDFIASVDVFIFYDDVQYTKGDWRNRNLIKTSQGVEWITVPVRHRTLAKLIRDTEIDYSSDWIARHLRVWEKWYGSCPYFDDALTILHDVFSRPHITISTLDMDLVHVICAYLRIDTPTRIASDLDASSGRTDRIIDIVRKVGGTTYLSGPSADTYLDKAAFREAGITLEYKTYDYSPYPQPWGDYLGGVTILDLIANCGPKAKDLIGSRQPNRVIVDCASR